MDKDHKNNNKTLPVLKGFDPLTLIDKKYTFKIPPSAYTTGIDVKIALNNSKNELVCFCFKTILAEPVHQEVLERTPTQGSVLAATFPVAKLEEERAIVPFTQCVARTARTDSSSEEGSSNHSAADEAFVPNYSLQREVRNIAPRDSAGKRTGGRDPYQALQRKLTYGEASRPAVKKPVTSVTQTRTVSTSKTTGTGHQFFHQSSTVTSAYQGRGSSQSPVEILDPPSIRKSKRKLDSVVDQEEEYHPSFFHHF